jgi:hypothetical protein
MATSISDLLDALDHAGAGPTGHDPDDAAGALGRAAHLLVRLRNDGIGAIALREDTTHRLAAACAEAAIAFTPGPGRIGDLIGVASDAIGRLRAVLTDDDRWTVAVALATTTRRCAGTIARSGTYMQVPQLLDVADRSRELIRVAARSPADPAQLIGQDLLIPTNLLPRGASPARVAAESMGALLTHLRAGGQEPLTLRALLGACYAAEATAFAGAAIIGNRSPAPRPEAARAWRELRAELARFTDGPRGKTEPGEPSLRCALRVYEGLQRTIKLDPAGRSDAQYAFGPDAELFRRTVLQLPALVGVLSNQLHRSCAWIAVGGSRPLHEGRVAEWLQHKAFLARGEDLYPAISALHRAAQATNRLIITLDTVDRQSAARGSIARARADTALSRR